MTKKPESTLKIYEMSFYNQMPEFFVRYKDIEHLLNPTPKPDVARDEEVKVLRKALEVIGRAIPVSAHMSEVELEMASAAIRALQHTSQKDAKDV